LSRLQHVLVRAFARLHEDSDPTEPRDGLREQFQTLADYLRGGGGGQSRDIAARPRKAGDEPVGNRIGSTKEDNGYGPGRLLGGQGLGCASGHEDINLERNQFGRESGEPRRLPPGISEFNHDVAALDVTEVAQSLDIDHVEVGERTRPPCLQAVLQRGHDARHRALREGRGLQQWLERAPNPARVAASQVRGDIASFTSGIRR
jgi:hypothetical protein